MVGGAYPQHRIGIEVRPDVERGKGDRGRRVASDRLEQAMAGQLGIDLGELARDQKILRLGADCDDPVGRGERDHPSRRLLQQALVAHQPGEVLGQGLPADRPEPGSDAAGENDGDERGRGHGGPIRARDPTEANAPAPRSSR